MKISPWPYQIGVGACRITPRQKRYIGNVLHSNRITYGPMIQQFEKEFTCAHGRRYGIFCNSGTSALRVSIGALKEYYRWQDGDEILIPATTFVADLNVVLHHRLRPVFVDIHPELYTIDPIHIEKALSSLSRARAIMPVHAFGLPAEMKEIMTIARHHRLRVLEDACESGFVTYRKKPVGSFGDIACFSTYQAHLLTTGVGGFALTDHARLAVIMRSLVNHGRDGIYLKIDDDKTSNEKKRNEIISKRFRFVRSGYSFRATELEAALGLATLHDGMDRIIARRRRVAHELIAVLTPFVDFLQFPVFSRYAEHAFMMFPIVIRNKTISRDALVNFLEHYNIETRPMLPLINQPYAKKLFGDLSKQCPVSDYINKKGFYIGCHEYISAEEIAFIGKVFKCFFKRVCT